MSLTRTSTLACRSASSAALAEPTAIACAPARRKIVVNSSRASAWSSTTNTLTPERFVSIDRARSSAVGAVGCAFTGSTDRAASGSSTTKVAP
jgi:hypothetical protein